MPRIYVEFANLKANGDKCKAIAYIINDIHDDFQRTISQLDWDIKFQSDINNTAIKLMLKLKNYEAALKKYQSFIDEAYNNYLDLDDEKVDFELKAGFNASTYLKENIPTEILKFFSEQGIESVLDSMASKSFGNIKVAGGSVSSAVAGAATSFYFSYYENLYERQQNNDTMSEGRMWSEIGVEGAADAALGLGITAVLTAAGVTAAPAVVVAAAVGFGINMGLDAWSSKCGSGSWTEDVSWFFLDEYPRRAGVCASLVKEGAKAAWDFISFWD